MSCLALAPRASFLSSSYLCPVSPTSLMPTVHTTIPPVRPPPGSRSPEGNDNTFEELHLLKAPVPPRPLILLHTAVMLISYKAVHIILLSCSKASSFSENQGLQRQVPAPNLVSPKEALQLARCAFFPSFYGTSRIHHLSRPSPQIF